MIIIKALMEKHNFHFDDDFGGSGDGGWNRESSPYTTPSYWFTTMSEWYYRSMTTPGPDWYDTSSEPDSGNYFDTTAGYPYDWNSEPSTTEAPYDWNSYTTRYPE